ncbi:MAG: hypothetical protein ACK2U4_14000, partial [Candidatus Promineifilaceae bacterium]
MLAATITGASGCPDQTPLQARSTNVQSTCDQPSGSLPLYPIFVIVGVAFPHGDSSENKRLSHKDTKETYENFV